MAYVGNTPSRGQWRKLTDISGSFDGVTTTFTTSVPPGTSQYYVTAGTASQLIISLGGVIQEPDVDYSVSTNSITFTTAPTAGLSFFGVLCGDALNTGVPSDGSITTSKLGGNLTVDLASGSAATPSLTFDSNTGLYSPGEDQVAVSTGGTGRLFIDSSGRVGIGTTSPGYVLDVAATGSTVGASIGSDQSICWFFLKDSGTTLGHVRVGSMSGQLLFHCGNSERARIDSSGRLLVGTSSSRSWAGVDSLLQIEGSNSYATQSIIGNSADTVGALLALGKTRGTTTGSTTVVQSGDILGRVYFVGADGSALIQGATITGEVDGTPGANDMPGRLVFSTTADGASSPTERMRIRQDGHVCINTTVPASQTSFGTYFDGQAIGYFSSFRNVNGLSAACALGGNAGYAAVMGDGDLENTNNRYTGISDIKLKQNIEDAASQWDDIKSIQVRKYELISNPDRKHIGCVAQELEQICPGLVLEREDQQGETYKSVAYSVLYMKAVKALQEAMERIETLEAKVAALESA